MPTVEGLQFRYSLYLMPPGRFPFRRWKWELWHGATLLASGWRVSRRDAGRALRSYAARHAHRLFGLTAPDEATLRRLTDDLVPGATERLHVGAVTCVLLPRALEEPALALS